MDRAEQVRGLMTRTAACSHEAKLLGLTEAHYQLERAMEKLGVALFESMGDDFVERLGRVLEENDVDADRPF